MTWPMDISFSRYLLSKRSVDDRALNQNVFTALAERVRATFGDGPLRALEVGAGIGTMVERLSAWGLFNDKTVVTVIDHDPQNVSAGQERLSSAAMRLEWEAVDVFEFAQRERGARQWDALIAHAFLDLVDSRRLLPLLRDLISPQGVAYFTINFDGVSILQPTLDPAFDPQIEALYHQTMDRRVVNGLTSGDSQSGRHLFVHLAEAGFDVIAAGSSDWTVFPRRGEYPEDEAYFLHFIIQTMQNALRGSPELDQAALARWADRRHQQIEEGELVYIAHQIDFLATPAG